MSQADWLEKDYYAVLGVDRSASAEEIRKAYRRLAREHHPDANPDDPRAAERFKEIGEAYGVLSDPEQRAQYDRIREMAAAGVGGFGSGFPGGAGGGAAGGMRVEDLSDLLGGLFGEGTRVGGQRRRAGTRPQRGRDLETQVHLDFEDALSGVTVTLRVTGRAVCSTCDGSGARPGTAPTPCATCGGNGVVAQDQGFFSFSQPCPACGGRGVQITDPCPTCRGSGVENRPRTVRARIPAGVKDGARVRLPGKGEPGLGGGPAGDLYVTVRVADHPVFGRRGRDVTMTVPVTFAEAALGAEITVPTLGEPVTLKVPPGTQSGQTLRVRGKGTPEGGDMLVTVQVAVPTKLTKTQRKMLEEFAATDSADVRAHLDEMLAGRR